jgi:hypothetical protein
VRESNVDRRLLGHFERSWERQDKARRILPERWLTDERPAAQQLNELFLDLIERARTRVYDERDAFAMQLSAVDGLD